MDAALPAIRVPDRWLRDQQFILAATRHIERQEPSVSDQATLFSFLHDNSSVPIGPDLVRYRKRLEELPPTALELLCSFEADHVDMWIDHQDLWKEVLAKLQWDSKHRISRFSGAKLLANRITTGWLSPSRLCRIAWLEMHADGWEAAPNIGRRLARLTTSFQGGTNPYQKLHALGEFRNERTPSCWTMVENALLQEVFSWPLLVPDNQAIAYALPVIVDVALGVGEGNDDAPFAQIISGENILADDWQKHLETARDAAIKLWETKRGANAEVLQSLVRKARVTLDLRVASEIFHSEFPHGKLELTDGSLGAYAAMEILSRILGQTTCGRVAASGTLNEFVDNGIGDYGSDGGDYTIDCVGGILSKVRCAARTFYFDKIIVPVNSTVEIENDRDVEESFDIEIIEAYDPSNRLGRDVENNGMFGAYAKFSLGQSWRNHRYVRCPDIEFAFKSEKPAGQRKVIPSRFNVSREILRNERPWYNPVIDFGSQYSGAEIARVLYWKLRIAEWDDNWPTIPGDKRRGNFAFVRTTGNEQRERFWATVWDACGGEAEGFRDFTQSINAPEAARHLAGLLNNLAPTDQRRARAPDVLVIIGANRLMRGDEETLGSSAENDQFRFSSLLKELSKPGVLDRCPNRVLQTKLLNCRIIAVDEDDRDRRSLQAHKLRPELQKPFVRLSNLRRGFSLPIAQSMLGFDRESTRLVLDDLCECRYDGIPLVQYSEGADEYWMNYRPSFIDKRMEYRQHIQAANALVGILDRTERPGHEDFATSLNPENLHEAQWHIERALRLSETRSTDWSTARSYRERLNRIGEPFTWSQLAWNVKNSHEASEEVWTEVREAAKAIGVSSLNLTQLLYAAQFADKLSKRAGPKQQYFASAYGKIIGYALRRIRTLPARQSNAARFKILTFKSFVAMRSSPDDRGAAATAADNVSAWNCYPLHGGEIVHSEWFEQYGDATDNHRDALVRYSKGFLNQSVSGATNLRLSTMVKWLGCLWLTGEQATVGQRRAIADALTDEHWDTLNNWDAGGDPLKSGLHRRPVASRRLGAGLQLILSRGFLDA